MYVKTTQKDVTEVAQYGEEANVWLAEIQPTETTERPVTEYTDGYTRREQERFGLEQGRLSDHQRRERLRWLDNESSKFDTQSQLADALDRTPGTIRKYKRGDLSIPAEVMRRVNGHFQAEFGQDGGFQARRERVLYYETITRDASWQVTNTTLGSHILRPKSCRTVRNEYSQPGFEMLKDFLNYVLDASETGQRVRITYNIHLIAVDGCREQGTTMWHTPAQAAPAHKLANAPPEAMLSEISEQIEQINQRVSYRFIPDKIQFEILTAKPLSREIIEGAARAAGGERP